MNMPKEIGRLDNKAVYLTYNCLAVEEDHMYLRPLNNEEIARFVHKELMEKEVSNV